MAAQADILAQIAGGGLEKTTPKYGDVQKNQLSLDETRAKSNDLKIAEANRVKQAKDIKLLNDSFTSSGGDLKATRNQYIKMGGGIPVLMQWEESNAKTRKLIGETDEQMAKAAALKATNLSQMLTGYNALPPDQQEQVRPQVEAQLRQDGHLGPTESLDGNKAALLIAQGRSFADMTGRIHADAAAKQAATSTENIADEMAQRQALRPSVIAKAAADAATAEAGAATAVDEKTAEMRLKNAQAAKAEAEASAGPKIETETVDLMVGGKPHQVMIEKGTGKVIKDLGEKGSIAAAGEPGTWSIQEDSSGNPVMFNSKTAQVKPVEGLAKTGTKAKADAAIEKQIGPARDAIGYAKSYLDGGAYTGPGDEALMEKFFDVAKPSTGFRMTQSQIDMLKSSQGAINSITAKAKHLIDPSGPWFSDDQRKNIVKTMSDLADVKLKAVSGDAGVPPLKAPPKVGQIEDGHVFLGGDPSKPTSWKPVSK